MKNMICITAVAGMMLFGGVADAAAQPLDTVPRTAFFIGLGGSYNSVEFNNNRIYAQGVSNIYLDGSLVAYGSAGGPADPFSDSRSTFAPVAQVGYFQHFPGSNWLWGAKFLYSYLGASAINYNVDVPQSGSFVSANSSTFTGNVVIRSYQASISHQMALMPLIGHSFDRSFVYLGAGPTLAQTKSKLNGVIGFADISGTRTDITGVPSNFSSSPWRIGGAAVVGATYFLDPSWFLDLSYTYAMTGRHTSAFSTPFASTTSGYVDTGILSGTYSGKLITQSFRISINKAF